MKRRMTTKTFAYLYYNYPSLDDFDIHFDVDLDFHLLSFLLLGLLLFVFRAYRTVTKIYNNICTQETLLPLSQFSHFCLTFF